MEDNGTGRGGGRGNTNGDGGYRRRGQGSPPVGAVVKRQRMCEAEAMADVIPEAQCSSSAAVVTVTGPETATKTVTVTSVATPKIEPTDKHFLRLPNLESDAKYSLDEIRPELAAAFQKSIDVLRENEWLLCKILNFPKMTPLETQKLVWLTERNFKPLRAFGMEQKKHGGECHLVLYKMARCPGGGGVPAGGAAGEAGHFGGAHAAPDAGGGGGGGDDPDATIHE